MRSHPQPPVTEALQKRVTFQSQGGMSPPQRAPIAALRFSNTILRTPLPRTKSCFPVAGLPMKEPIS